MYDPSRSVVAMPSGASVPLVETKKIVAPATGIPSTSVARPRTVIGVVIGAGSLGSAATVVRLGPAAAWFFVFSIDCIPAPGVRRAAIAKVRAAESPRNTPRAAIHFNVLRKRARLTPLSSEFTAEEATVAAHRPVASCIAAWTVELAQATGTVVDAARAVSAPLRNATAGVKPRRTSRRATALDHGRLGSLRCAVDTQVAAAACSCVRPSRSHNTIGTR